MLRTRAPSPAGAAILLVGAVSVASTVRARELAFDFESGDLQGWKVLEGKFDRFLTDRPDFHHGQGKYNKQGKWFVSTLERRDNRPDDSFTGVAESPVFVLSGAEMSLLVGGGGHGDTRVSLCSLEGKEVLTARGRNAQVMQRIKWKAPKLVGKKVFLRMVDSNTGSWGHITLDDFRAKGTVDLAATKAYCRRRKPLGVGGAPAGGEGDVEALRAAIEDLISTFGTKYPGGREFLARLKEMGDEPGEEFGKLRREALVANPLVSGQPILYVSRKQWPGDHHNTANMFQTNEINTGKYRSRGYLKMVDFAKGGEAKVETILDPGPTSTPRDPELSFDGKKIVFSMRKSVKDDYHIYTVNADGSRFKQLTSAPGVFDIDPLYLADGHIAFTSSREPKYCMCNRHIMGNLFRMEPDGANIYQIGKSTLFEGHGALMPDGRIMYYRWEYIDRNFGDAQGLWVVNPDGTNHAVYWANNTGSPGGVLDARIVPGTQLAICTFSSCHDRPWGAMAIIDRRKGIDDPAAVVRIWPASARKLVNPRAGFDTFKKVRPRYEDPYPLSDKHFLVSRTTHTDPLGYFDPMPVAPRRRPDAKPVMRDFKNDVGTFYVQDVYIGTHMQGVERGSIKSLRVIESPEKRNWTHPSWGGQGVHCPGLNWHNFENKRILGTVPVESDGSANFEVPSDRYVYFQALDANGMMVQSMRSGTIIQSGEQQGCVGCHENRVEDAPPMTRNPKALRRRPSKLDGWHGKPRIFSFQRDVQPVFTRNCVKCHDFGKKAGKKLVLARDRTGCFNASYTDLWSRNYIKCVGGGPAAIQQAKSWGSHASKLVKILREGAEQHKDLRLPPEDLERIITWVDLNAPYYPYYESAYPNGQCGRCPLTKQQFDRLKKLTRAPFVTGHGRNKRAQIAFERPELSPCLARLKKDSPEYNEALAIIRAGGEQLKRIPRADMEGFVPCQKDRERNAKYDARAAVERRNREAIRTGRKVYD
jgi:hypothetical protein